MRRLPSGRLVFLAGCLAVALFKVCLVGTDEILARNQPHDDLWFVTSASHWYWSAPAESAMLRPPAYPLWIAAVRLTGIPLRIAVELLLLGSAFVLALALLHAGLHPAFGLLFYAVVALNPVGVLVNRYALAGTLYAPLLLLFFACALFTMLAANARRRLTFGVLGGVTLAALWFTRQETPLLVLYLLVLLLLVALVLRSRSRRELFGGLVAVAVVPSSVLVTAVVAVRSVNLARFGVFADSEMSSPGLTDAYEALVGIVPAVPMRFIPVPKEVRERAYAVSPAFRTLRPHLEGPLGQGWQSHTLRILGIRGETAAGWMIFALRDAAIHAGHRAPSDREALFRRIRKEIHEACGDGRLRCRRVLSQVLDPDPGNYAGHMPASVLRVSRWFAAPSSVFAGAEGEQPVSPSIRELFDRMANRRAALVGNVRVWFHVRGWAFHAGDPLTSVVARDRATGSVVQATAAFHPRPDVRKALGEDVPLQSGFRIAIPVRSRRQPPSLHLVTRSGREFGVPYERRLEMSRPLRERDADAPPGLRYAIGAVEQTVVTRTWTDEAKTAVARVHGPVVFILTTLALAALVVLALGVARPGARHPLPAPTAPGTAIADPLLLIAVFVIAIVALRVALYAVLDASAWPSAQPRYLWPAVALYPAAPIVLIDRGVREWRFRRMQRGGVSDAST
ncbi:MAG TPA: hypothetical protein VFP98_04005 [Candidatus Polarisedimenticolia bacterium]|nr:hypothetical protein [Candidatus Polarisedimenticolia bacterium]